MGVTVVGGYVQYVAIPPQTPPLSRDTLRANICQSPMIATYVVRESLPNMHLSCIKREDI